MHKGKPLDMKNVLVVSKVTRYEYEKDKHNASDDQLRGILSARGSDYDRLRIRYDIHQDSMQKIEASLQKRGIDPRVVKARDYKKEDLKDIDIVFPAGGDGTFLQAARYVADNTPVVGINTDLARSEGHFCSTDADEFDSDIENMLNGDFREARLSRIRIILIEKGKSRMLDHYALNDVVIAEHDFSKTAYYELAVDSSTYEKQKSSGVIICTGSGSTAWLYNETKMYAKDVEKILELGGTKADDSLIQRITNEFNQSHVFDRESDELEYHVRAPIVNGIFGVTMQQGFGRWLRVRSRLWDGRLVVDGITEHEFSDSGIALLEISKKHSLRSIVF